MFDSSSYDNPTPLARADASMDVFPRGDLIDRTSVVVCVANKLSDLSMASLPSLSPTSLAYPRRWIGPGGPANWPARSPDLSCLDFFLWRHMKNLVYPSPVDSDETLVSKIAVVASEIRKMSRVFADVRHFLHRRCEACIFVGGRIFEQFL
ncbi:uncharacterized protein TNCV_3541491 [Trichonephila clavipes]|nr:uncharacterized protein TNCV_3541491 [Trichonephila clavipes]